METHSDLVATNKTVTEYRGHYISLAHNPHVDRWVVSEGPAIGLRIVARYLARMHRGN